jgi:ABC-type sugar transport system ATPase subunit
VVASAVAMPAPAGATPIFSARGLTKVYEMGEVRVDALRGVDFELASGEFVVLLGPSGSGKSTLLNILGGLDIPTAGTVVYGNQNLTRATEPELTAYRRTHVGFVFQFYNLIPSLTARENVALVTELVERPMSAWDSVWTTSPRSSPAASSSGSRLRARSPSSRLSCSVTSRRVRSTSPPAWWCSRRSSASTASSGRPRW